MNVVDSSGWLEVLRNAPTAFRFAEVIEKPRHRIVPTITLFEVYRRLLQQVDRDQAYKIVESMEAGLVVDMTAELAYLGADLSHQHGLSLADGIIYATAVHHEAELWTQDAHFQNLPHVRYFPKQT